MAADNGETHLRDEFPNRFFRALFRVEDDSNFPLGIGCSARHDAFFFSEQGIESNRTRDAGEPLHLKEESGACASRHRLDWIQRAYACESDDLHELSAKHGLLLA